MHSDSVAGIAPASVQTYSTQYPHIPVDKDGVLLFNPKRVKYFHLNPRKTFRSIAKLALAIKTTGKQLKPGTVRIINDPQYDCELIDGERRIRAVKMLHEEDPSWLFRAFVDSDVTDVRTQFLHSYAANFGHEAHDCLETAVAIKQCAEFGLTLEEIGRLSGGKTGAWASQQLNLLKLDPRVQKMLVSGETDDEDGASKMTPTLAQKLVRLDHETQYRAALEITEKKMTHTQARRYVFQVGRALGKPMAIGQSKRNSSFQTLLTFTQATADSLGIYNDLSPAELDQLFGNQPTPQLKLLKLRIKNLVQDLELLKTAVQKYAG